MRRLFLLVALAIALGACQYPRDVEGTLDRVRGGVMHVGISESDPWVRTGGREPGGVEVQLLERFARTIDARIEWVHGSESELIDALHGRKLDVVAAGLNRRSEWQRVAALTRPYLTTKVVIAAPDEQTAAELSDDLGGRRIAVEANSPEASKLSQDTDAISREVADPAQQAHGPVAIDDFMLDELGLVPTDAELDEHEHCMAVAMGENAFLVELERFLLDREHEAAQILEQEARA
jgi:polar amino acid transport system substrate-binding protein